jgi:hypothetical protein
MEWEKKEREKKGRGDGRGGDGGREIKSEKKGRAGTGREGVVHVHRGPLE